MFKIVGEVVDFAVMQLLYNGVRVMIYLGKRVTRLTLPGVIEK